MRRRLSFFLALLLLLSACTVLPKASGPSSDPQHTGTALLPERSPAQSAPTEEALPTQTPPPEAGPSETPPAQTAQPSPAEQTLAEDGSYTAKEDVALYIHLYGRLPSNFITKRQAQDLGWPGGSLEPYAPGMCIGGSRFGNYEGLLPEAKGRTYTECDIDTLGADSRGAKRIVFSNDGLIYYTEDHYASFELLYGEE